MKSFFILAALVMLTSSVAFADFGTRGGGRSLTVEQQARIRDLVDVTTLECFDGDTFKASQSYAASLENLAGLHWYLANRLDREASKLRFCLTYGDLKPITVDSPLAPTVVRHMGDQLAIRDGDVVVIDRKIMNAVDERGVTDPKRSPMLERDRTFLIFHEAMHALLKHGPKHDERLRSMIAEISRQEGEDLGYKHLAEQMKQSQVMMISSTRRLDHLKDLLLKALDPDASLGEKFGFLAHPDLRRLIESKYPRISRVGTDAELAQVDFEEVLFSPEDLRELHHLKEMLLVLEPRL